MMHDMEIYAPEVLEGAIETGYIYIENGGLQPVTYAVCGDMAIYEGDIVLGTVDTMRRIRELVDRCSNKTSGEAEYAAMIAAACAISTMGKWWKYAVIPFEIKSATNVTAINAGVEYINKYTPLKLVKRKYETDYVAFMQSTGCSSRVGRSGGEQAINIADWAGFGNVVHEVFHASGLWHEHSRADRDQYVIYTEANVTPTSSKHNFLLHTTDATCLGKYDYDSIMHYSDKAFAKAGTQTLVPRTSGVTIGQRDHASVSDILGLAYMRVKA